MSIHSEATLDRKFIEFMKLLNVYLNHFPKYEKYGLTLQIRNTAFEMYGYIVESQKRFHKKTSLTNLDIKHEQLRMFIRLAYELGYFAFRDGSFIFSSDEKAEHRYLTISSRIDELGKMIGGWINSQKE